MALAALLAGAGCASSLALVQEAPSSEPAADAPNVVFVLTDDMRYEEFEKVARFREFAREGTFFERAYVTNSMCCPSRSTALTGRYSHNHGVLSNKTRGDVRGGFGAHKNLGTGAHNLGNGLADALGAAGRKAHPLILRPETVPTAEVATTFELDGQISGQVRDALADGQFPLVLSGNCNASVGTIAGAGGPGVVWFDAHADFNTPETTTTGFTDGMVLAVAVGHCWQKMAGGVPGFSPVAAEDVLLAGVRDVQPAEEERLAASRVTVVEADRIGREGPRALAAALDGLSPGLAGSTCTSTSTSSTPQRRAGRTNLPRKGD